MALYFVLLQNFKNPAMLDAQPGPCSVPLLTDFRPNEIVWLMFEWGLWIDQRHQVMMRRRTGAPKPEGFSRIAILSDVLLVLALASQLVEHAVHRLKAQAAPTQPGAPLEPLGGLPWPQELASTGAR